MGDFTKDELAKIKAKEAGWKRQGAINEQAQYDRMLKPIREAGATAVQGMEQGRMDQQGNAYKKGGKVKASWHGFEASTSGKNKHGF
jgi:hypothetical protein